MKITFNVDYRTNWGESLYIVGNIPQLGNDDEAHAMPLELEAGHRWSLTIDVNISQTVFEYRYFMKHDNGYVRREWGEPHSCNLSPNAPEALIFDEWQDMPWDKPYYSKAFTQCVNARPERCTVLPAKAGTLTIKVQAPMIAPDEQLAICGSIPQLGNWDTTKALVMNDAQFPRWSVELSLDDIQFPFEYKYLIVKRASREVVAWEASDNHRLNIIPPSLSAIVMVAGARFASPLDRWRGAGVAIPVFSLRSNDDFGVGDFYDLKKMVDWAAATGQRFIQILPINDTTMTHTWTDSYPYNANSTFALHPMFLRLEAMGQLNDPARRDYYDALKVELNKLPQVDYERVNEAKVAYTRELFHQEGKSIVESNEFKHFVARNRSWLIPYAAFCTLRDRYHSADPANWEEFAIYNESAIEHFVTQNIEDINFVCFQQFFLDKQMRHVVDYAHSKGVAIKGDIPIGISRTSVDAWTSPQLFNLDCSAGAPPDDFSVLGQNWGFPTYNWEEMGRDGFAWWKARFRKMSEYFDAYRIDHVLGFFRIWQIPLDALHGLLGVFNPALPFTPDELRYNYDFWIDVDLQTTPYIMDHFLGDFFGEYVDEVRNNFLIDAGYGRYRLKEEFDTQRKVADYFAAQPKDDKNTRICNGLLGLIDDVLFIEDPYEKGKYHPRISAQFTYIYRSLTDYEKWCFNRLYNDFYYHRHNDFWYGKAMWKLPPLIDATDMLVCAEDLGMIPACVPAVMDALEILSLEIQRMPKDPKAEFGDTWHYPYLSVCTTSTHDMGGIRQWWEENREKTQHYYNNVLHEGGEAPFYAEPWICEKIVDLHFKSPSMLCILPLQDMLSIDGDMRREDPRDEQINIPAIPRHYWRYRMHLTLEDLIDATKFNEKLSAMIKSSGR